MEAPVDDAEPKSALQKSEERAEGVQDVDNLRITVDVRKDPDDGLYQAACRELQGCHTFAGTEKEALERISKVILDHIDARLRKALAEVLQLPPSAHTGGHAHVVKLPP